MKKTQLHYFVYLAKSGGLLILASLLSNYVGIISDHFPSPWLRHHFGTISTTVLYLFMLFLWCRKTYIRVVSRRLKALFVSSSVLVMLWFVFRLIKYTTEDLLLGRYMWYNYYLAIIFLPLLSLHIALILRNPEAKRLGRFYSVMGTIALALYLLVLTNNLHNFVFKHYGAGNADSDYSYNWGYYLIYAWVGCVAILTFILVIRESRIILSGFYFMYPIGLLLVGCTYSIVAMLLKQNYGIKPFFDNTPLYCWIFCAIWEFFITAGLIPTNRYYVEYFNESLLSAYITDKSGNILYQSKNADPLTEEEYYALMESGKITCDDDSEAYVYSMKNEYVIYEYDTTEVMDMIEELEDARENLMGEKFIRQKANEAEAARIRIEEKEYIFEKLTAATISQLRRIRENMKLIKDSEGDAEKKLWEETVILGTYVKRCSNLLLLQEGDPKISVIELQLSVQQTMENLKLMGVNTGMMFKAEGYTNVDPILQCYELFENIIEWDLRGLKGIHVMFSMRAEQCIFLIEAECEKGFEDFVYFEYIGKLEVETEDNTISASLIWNNSLKGGTDYDQ